MYQVCSTIFLGGQKPGSFSGASTSSNFFLVLEIENIDSARGGEALKTIKNDIQEANITNLADFESFFVEEIKKTNLPSQFSLAAGYLKDNILYLRTSGEGEIYLSRKHQFAKIISGENSASGYPQVDDLYTFSTFSFTMALGGEKGVKKSIEKKQPEKIVADLKARFQDFDNHGLTSVFMQIANLPHISEPTDVSVLPPTTFFHKLVAVCQNLKFQSEKTGKKKTLTLLAVILIALILIWSVVLGRKRMRDAAAQKKITVASELITQKLNQAEDGIRDADVTGVQTCALPILTQNY